MSRILLSGLLAAGLFCTLPASATTGCLLFADGSGKVRVLNTTPPRGLMVVLTHHHRAAEPHPDNETPC